jgi:hypothetical protein
MLTDEKLSTAPAALQWLKGHAWSKESFWDDILRYESDIDLLRRKGYVLTKTLSAELLEQLSVGALEVLRVSQTEVEQSCVTHLKRAPCASSLLTTMNHLQGVSATSRPFVWNAAVVNTLMQQKITPWDWLERWTEMVHNKYQCEEALVQMLVLFLRSDEADKISWGARIHADPYLEIVALWTAIQSCKGDAKYHFRNIRDPDIIIDAYADSYCEEWPMIKMMGLSFKEAYAMGQSSHTDAITLPGEMTY